jgi:electron transfer flavoprotein beta subunit
MPALQKAKSVPLAAGGLHFLSATPPKQQRQTRVVKDLSPDQIAQELAEWIGK